MSGARVTSLGLTVEAGQLINMDYSLAGTEYFFNPISITSANNKLDFDDGGSEVTFTIPSKLYKDPIELAEAIEIGMNALTSDVITVTYSSSTGKYTIATDGTELNLLFATGTNNASSIDTTLGFASADQTGALTYTGASALDFSSPQTPVYDSSSPLAAKNHQVLLGGATDTACFAASSLSFTIDTPATDILSVCAASGKSGSIINSRAVTGTITALLDQYEVSKFESFRKGSNVKLQYTFGEKVGGQWAEGKSGALFLPTCTITSFNITSNDNLATLELGIAGYVNDSGEGECFLSFV